MLKIASHPRKMGDDYINFKKRAGIFDFDAIVASLKPGEVPIHVIALGADECYGPNRNGDSFTKESCRKYHGTFKKYARWFREHDHYDPEKSYGIVKFSAFNEKLGRVELIVALNGTKEAAQRNKGLVADKELEALERGEDLGVSMACKVAYDVCSGCGNKARNRMEYCGPEKCTKYGGLKFNIGKTFDDGHILRAFNPEPKWFDISYVAVPADRIAYSTGKIPFVKESSGPRWLYRLSPRDVYTQIEALSKLAYFEKNFLPEWFKLASSYKYPSYSIKEAAYAIRYQDLPEAVWALSSNGIILPPEDFLQAFGDVTEEEAVKVGQEVRTVLPGIFNSLLNKKDLAKDLEFNIFYPKKPEQPIVIPDTAIRFLSKTGSTSEGLKSYTPSRNPKVKELAETYAFYQLGSVSYWSDSQLQNEVARRAIILNRAI